jgi:hypothetical protein
MRSEVMGVPVIVGARLVDPDGGGAYRPKSSDSRLRLVSKHALHSNATMQTTASFRADEDVALIFKSALGSVP